MGNSYQQGNSNHYSWDQPGYYDSGYSMTGSDVHSHLENAMRSARNENEREAIRQAMNRINM